MCLRTMFIHLEWNSCVVIVGCWPVVEREEDPLRKERRRRRIYKKLFSLPTNKQLGCMHTQRDGLQHGLDLLQDSRSFTNNITNETLSCFWAHFIAPSHLVVIFFLRRVERSMPGEYQRSHAGRSNRNKWIWQDEEPLASTGSKWFLLLSLSRKHRRMTLWR